MPRKASVVAVIAACLLGALAPAAADPVTGRVRGAVSVNVRRGPGTDTPAFAVLGHGEPVRVEETTGQWARILLPDGQRGYVNAAFVEMPPGSTPGGAATADAALAGEPTPTLEPPASAAATLDGELAQLRQRLAQLESAVATATPTDVAVPGGPSGDTHTAPVLPTVAVVAPPDTFGVGPAMALAGVGFVVGFLFGTLYGQRQERRSRSRVRF